MVLAVFGDESTDETKERSFAVAGVVGNEELWQPLQQKWIARCDGVPFHAKDCDSDYGDFARFTHEDNKARYRDLTSLLADSGLGGFGIVLNLISRRAIFPEAPAGLDYYKGFIELIQKMQAVAAYNHSTVEFTFDARPESEFNTVLLYSLAKQAKEWSIQLAPKISFAVAREEPRVQVADLLAREVMKSLDNDIAPTKRPPRKSWLRLRQTERFHCEEFSEEWYKALKEHLPELAEKTGMSMQDYARWLIFTKRMVDNISNRFGYMKYINDRNGDEKD